MVEIIGEQRKSTFDPDLAREINEKIERKALEERIKAKKEPQENNTKTQNLLDYWTIPNVKYKDKIVKIDLAKELLNEVKKDRFEIADAQLHYSIFKALYDNSDNLGTEEIKKFLKESFSRKITTATNIEYRLTGDLVIHNLIENHLSDRYITSTEIVGSNEYIKDSITPQKYKAILGSNNLQEIDEVFKWLFGGDIFAFFVNDNLGMQKSFIRNVKFSVDSGGINLICTGNLDNECRALGMCYSHENNL
ncbi:MAG: hypothetical protein PHD81_03070 [Candidatus Nanoarchaeia archaeon]|nr:hypothetical protein [Candidatus Nanoarchaeia archaeon]MDD5588066.1 hypothetical protein [Candidatus Nanoarchaeia archaeon]